MLGVDGFLSDDVVLVSVGDHFDYHAKDGTDPRHDGLAILRWLAEHAPSQAPLLLGNHDAARVMELARVSDSDFAKLRAVALDDPDDAAWAALTDIPTPGLVARDYASFSEAQRALVADLLRAGRYHLGLAATLPGGTPALITHAGVTVREVGMLGVDANPPALAAALDARLKAAVANGLAPLDLAPLHLAGEQPREGGGLLYHRPAESPGSDERRRYHPRDLPAGLVQIAGHTTHAKAKKELAQWVTPAAASVDHGVLRTLIVDGERIAYDAGVVAPPPGAAVLYLVDAAMNDPELDPELLPVFEVETLLR
jgi:hypothetical protein